MECDQSESKPQYNTFTYEGVKFKKSAYDFERITKVIPAMEMRESDVLIASYPKTGTNWMKYILSLLGCDGDKNVVDEKCIVEHVEFLEMAMNLFTGKPSETNGELVERWKKMESPRLFNTHLNFSMMPPAVKQGKVKVVMMVRNPKDVITSMYSFVTSVKSLPAFVGPFEEFLQCFMTGDLSYGGGTYPDFYKSWWEQRNKIPIVFVHYEDMKRDPKAEIQRVAKFIGKDITAEQLNDIVRSSSFKSMREAPSTKPLTDVLMDATKSSFFRKGVVGDWKNTLTDAQSEMIDAWIEKQFEGSDFLFEVN